MTLPTISEAPTFPQPGDSGDVFNDRALAMAAYIADMPDEYNALAAAMESYAQSLSTGTSTTSNSIAGTGTKTFTTQTGLAFSAGQPIIVASASGPANYMVGTVSSYTPSNGQLSIAVSGSGGTGTKTDWQIGLLPSVTALGAYLALTGGSMTGLLTLAAATGLLLTPGSDPGSPSNGQLWAKTAGLFTRVAGATKQLMTTDGTLQGYKEVPYTITDGAAFEIDPANGSMQTITLGASRTPKATNMANGQSVLLGVDDGTAYTLTWTDTTFGASGVKWMDNSAPVLATSGLTWITLWKLGGQVYGMSPGATS